MNNDAKTNNYLIDPTFNKVNRLFSYPLKMKKAEYLFQTIIHQKSK